MIGRASVILVWASLASDIARRSMDLKNDMIRLGDLTRTSFLRLRPAFNDI